MAGYRVSALALRPAGQPVRCGMGLGRPLPSLESGHWVSGPAHLPASCFQPVPRMPQEGAGGLSLGWGPGQRHSCMFGGSLVLLAWLPGESCAVMPAPWYLHSGGSSPWPHCPDLLRSCSVR